MLILTLSPESKEINENKKKILNEKASIQGRFTTLTSIKFQSAIYLLLQFKS